jgi:hypothetical protein
MKEKYVVNVNLTESMHLLEIGWSHSPWRSKEQGHDLEICIAYYELYCKTEF